MQGATSSLHGEHAASRLYITEPFGLVQRMWGLMGAETGRPLEKSAICGVGSHVHARTREWSGDASVCARVP